MLVYLGHQAWQEWKLGRFSRTWLYSFVCASVRELQLDSFVCASVCELQLSYFTFENRCPLVAGLIEKLKFEFTKARNLYLTLSCLFIVWKTFKVLLLQSQKCAVLWKLILFTCILWLTQKFNQTPALINLFPFYCFADFSFTLVWFGLDEKRLNIRSVSVLTFNTSGEEPKRNPSSVISTKHAWTYSIDSSTIVKRLF